MSKKNRRRNLCISFAVAMTLSVPAYAGIQTTNLPLHNENMQAVSQADDNIVTVVSSVKSNEVAAGARKFIDSMSRRALGFLADGTLSKQQKTSEFKQLLQNSFDMKTIARFALGRYWRVATPEERKEYMKLFQDMVLNVYSQRFDEYTGQTLETRNVRAESDKDAIVSSFIIPQEGPEIQVDWRVRYKDGKYKVVDVIVEGVSMTVTQRSDFSAVIQRGGGNVSVLLEHLRSM